MRKGSCNPNKFYIELSLSQAEEYISFCILFLHMFMRIVSMLDIILCSISKHVIY